MEVGDLSICRIKNQIFDAFDIKSIRIKIEYVCTGLCQ